MTRNEIIEMARQAGINNSSNGLFFECDKHDLNRFAKLVEVKERNRLADELQKMPLNDTANSIAIWIRGQE